MNERVIKEFEDSTEALMKSISRFSDKQFNKVPFEGSWTAGEVAEHLFKSESNAVHVVNGKTEVTAGRKPDANEEQIRSIFLDYNTKFKSPEFILPSNEPKKTEDLIDGFQKTRDSLRKIIKDEDLSLTCSDFSFPGIGKMTRYEWLCFVTCHAIRHTRQMENIFEKLTERENAKT